LQKEKTTQSFAYHSITIWLGEDLFRTHLKQPN